MRTLLLTVLAALVLLAGLPAVGAAQEGDEAAVLVFTATGSFRHLSIPHAALVVERLGDQHGFTVEQTEDPGAFTDDNLARFDAVIWLLTTGTVLDDPGREAFERYIRGGGGWVGVHSAADTEYDWPFYGELLGGAWFHSHPIQQPGVVEVEDPDHPSTAHLPARWLIPFEEYYSFVANPRPHVRVLLTIDEDTYMQDPNTTHLPDGPAFPDGESGVMGDHPMAWCRDIDDGRAWYTALGHENWLYEHPDYQRHLVGGILTAAGVIEADCTPQAALPPDPAPAPVPEPDPVPDPDDEEPLPATGAGLAVLGMVAAIALLALTGGRRQARRVMRRSQPRGEDPARET